MSNSTDRSGFDGAPLGQESQYKTEYDPTLLFSIPRQLNREKLGILNGSPLPFIGEDVWNAYELSWLNSKGKPQVAIAEFYVPCDSENIVESKSFKLYLNSFNQTRIASSQALEVTLRQDLSVAFGGEVRVVMQPLSLSFGGTQQPSAGFACLDSLDIEVNQYNRAADILQLNSDGATVTKQWCSHLLKSNCPVTGQPDWASVFIRYEGVEIDPQSILKYLISYREQQDFHEHCVETIFTDMMSVCRPEKLTVYARYTRRGGMDINPFRSNFEACYGNWRVVRQ